MNLTSPDLTFAIRNNRLKKLQAQKVFEMFQDCYLGFCNKQFAKIILFRMFLLEELSSMDYKQPAEAVEAKMVKERKKESLFI